TEVEDIKGSQRIAVTAWVDSNSAIEFLVPEWFIKVVGYKFDAQPADTMKRIGRAMVTPAAGAANNAQRATGLKVKGGTKLIGAKITIPTPKAETGKQTEVFGSFSKKVGTKNITVKKRGLRVPGHLSNKAIQYWLFVTSTTVPQWFERGSYRFQVAGLNPAPALEGLGTAHKGTTA
ncbi:MAG TPA: hypothetical protein V6D21_07605, partial [Candidatus Obscuribacterales bacterium]